MLSFDRKGQERIPSRDFEDKKGKGVKKTAKNVILLVFYFMINVSKLSLLPIPIPLPPVHRLKNS